jgi:hypothetical protein
MLTQARQRQRRFMSIGSVTRLRKSSPTARRLRAFAAALLFACFAAAETFAAVHALDAAAHSGAEPCKICVSAASFGAGATAPHAAPLLAVEPAASLAVAAPHAAATRSIPLRPPSRAPPVRS